jgi:hypothetical protein
MRRLLMPVVLVLALPVGMALGQGSPPITVKVYPKVTPNKAGTPAHPHGVKIDLRITIGIPTDHTPPLVKEIDVWFPKGGLFNANAYPRCSVRTLDRLGPAGCPKDSIMGTGVGIARADLTHTYPHITVVNGSERVVYFYTVLNNPAQVQEPVPGTVTKLSGPWSYKLHVVIPKNLQVVAGVPIVLQSLHIYAGRGDWLSTTYCPRDRKWAWQGLAVFDNGQRISTHGAVGCRP